MVRRLFGFVAFLSLLVCVAVAGLWVRARNLPDTFTIKTSRSYDSGPPAKWAILQTYDGLQFTFRVKTTPAIFTRLSPWADEPPWRVLPPGGVTNRYGPRYVARVSSFARPLTPEEERAFASEIGGAYAAADVFEWRRARKLPPDIMQSVRSARASGPFWRRMGFMWNPRRGTLTVSTGGETPGVYRDVRAAAPFGPVVAAAAVLPACWLATGLRRRVVSRRRRSRGLCPDCGYDLRSSPGACPECGRPADEPAPKQRWWAPRAWFRLLPRRRPSFASIGAAAAVVALLILLTLDRDGPSDEARAQEARAAKAETHRLRKELEGKLADVEREVARLRAAGDEAGAKALEGELAQFRARASGKVQATGEEAELHVVGVQAGDLSASDLAARDATQNAMRQRIAAARTPAEQREAARAQFEAQRAGRNESRTQGRAVVEVHDTGRPVVLALCGHQPVKWDVRLIGNVRLKKVVLGGYSGQAVTGLPPGVEVEEHSHTVLSPNAFHAYRREGEEFEKARSALRSLTGLEVCTFQGRRQPGGVPFVVGPTNDNWQAQRLVAEVAPLHRRATAFERERLKASLGLRRFTALRYTQSSDGFPRQVVTPALFDPTGPLAALSGPLRGRATHFAIDPVGPTYYVVNSPHELARLDLQTGVTSPIAEDPNLESPSWCSGAAFDTRRRRLMMISYDGGGARLYTYAPDTGKWTLPGPIGRLPAYFGLAYVAEHDCFYALSASRGGGGDEPAAIVRVRADGVLEWRVPLAGVSAERLERFRPDPGPQIAAVGRHVAIILPPPFDPERLRRGRPAERPPDRLMLVDPLTAEVVYDADAEPHDAAPPPVPEPAEMERLWGELGGADEAKADGAMWRLAAAGDPAVEFLRAKFSGGADGVRRERALHVLSRVGTPAAARLLRELAPPPAGDVPATKGAAVE
ncbi:MAG TPA: hypothetical protein VFB66_23455 [Tepidisphaeraceae bacterium]|nr:hypothetical protein [Tepidisphaeraceae bacterium]